ncbi:MAG: exodeoxyribonuclease III [Rhodospirillaceae bacterium]
MSLKIASWNVNSVRRRLGGLAALADERAPDIVCLQETKATDDVFPALEVAALGYPHQAISGIKGYNGVAILSKLPLGQVETHAWCGKADGRHVSAVVAPEGGLPAIEVHSLYVPAGGELPDPARNPKFAQKLRFLAEQANWWAARGPKRERSVPARVLAGDFNVAPLVADVWSHERLKNVVTHTEIEIAHLAALKRAGGWVDAVRHLLGDEEQLFTWWSYRAADWAEADKGRRLDHVWVSEDLTDAVRTVEVVRDARDWDPPSDHVPVMIELARARAVAELREQMP